MSEKAIWAMSPAEMEAEIERLRADKRALADGLFDLRCRCGAGPDQEGPDVWQQIERLRASEERLRAERDDWKQTAETVKKFGDLEEARLRARLEIAMRSAGESNAAIRRALEGK